MNCCTDYTRLKLVGYNKHIYVKRDGEQLHNDGQLLAYGRNGRWYSKYSLAEEMFS